MTRPSLLAAALVLSVAPLTGTVLAQTAPSSPLKVTLSRFLVGKDAKGKEILLDKDSVRPGDVLAYQASAQNLIDKNLTDLNVNVPIPQNFVYVADSARMVVNGQVITPKFSIDGKTFAFAPLKKKVQVTKNGVTSTEEVTVSPNEYRAVQFPVAVLAAKSSVVGEIRTTVK
ncbi:hypothetical protein MF271_07250 [Deinococcus sp. KNUC1210]|uniref:hypothetical protein n=1 Tax=Deinococcus sp. KNUC1210 TaxID=2917691 RepID=UPI001EF06675|nr:hypothetical protein [Deinococcus sp. KNUC1210]ULH16377.1 hypothetical protein MF271_07250 [Deinococcus sp. KNUC1210]